jgi:hypothetical protein
LRDEVDTFAPNSYLAADRPAFAAYASNGSSLWNQTWFNSMFDFSGIAWDVHQAGTAITRCHIVMATHFERGGTVVFHRKNGTRFETQAGALARLSDYGIARDVTIRKISPCLEPDMTVYPLLDGAEVITSELRNAPLINAHFPHGGVRAFSAREVGSAFNLLSGGPTNLFPAAIQSAAVSGDSGHPSFVYFDGKLILVSLFWTGGAGSGPYYGAADLQQALRSAIADLG